VIASEGGTRVCTCPSPVYRARLTQGAANLQDLDSVSREDVQRSLGVKPMDKSSRFRGVSRKKGKWEAKVMLNRKWAYRELFDSEEDAARAYDRAVWRLKPGDAHAYVNFKDEVPADLPDDEIKISLSGSIPAALKATFMNHIQEVSSPGASVPGSPFAVSSPTSEAGSPQGTPRSMSPNRARRFFSSAASEDSSAGASAKLERAGNLSDLRPSSPSPLAECSSSRYMPPPAADEVQAAAAGPSTSVAQQEQRPPVEMDRDFSLAGMDWLKSLANVKDQNPSEVQSRNDQFLAAAAAAVQELGYHDQSAGSLQQAQQVQLVSHGNVGNSSSGGSRPVGAYGFTPSTSRFVPPPQLSLDETNASRDSPRQLKRKGSVNSRVEIDMGPAGTTTCEVELPRPSEWSPGVSPTGAARMHAASPRMLVDESSLATCHLDFPNLENAMPHIHSTVSSQSLSALPPAIAARLAANDGRARRVSDTDAVYAMQGQVSQSLDALRDTVDSSRSFSMGALRPLELEQESSNCVQRTSSLVDFHSALARSGIDRRDLRLPSPKPIITTGLQRQASLPVFATGKLFNSQDEEVLASLEPVMEKLERCSSLVAQEVLITRTMSADARMLKTTGSPFADPQYQTGFAQTGQLNTLGLRSSSFTSGVGTTANLRQKLALRGRSPLGPSNAGLVSLLSRMGSHTGRQRIIPREDQPVQSGWSVVSGCPLIARSVSSRESEPLAASNNDAVRSLDTSELSDSEDEDGDVAPPIALSCSVGCLSDGRPPAMARHASLIPGVCDLAAPMQLRAFNSHDGVYSQQVPRQ